MQHRSQPAFEAVFFDLCNTLLFFDYDLLPRVEYRGESVPTTSLKVHQVLKSKLPVDIPYFRFLEAFQESLSTVTDMRNREYQEISCLQRFRIMCQSLGLDPAAASLVVEIHMEEMLRIMYVPAETRQVLEALRGYPLVLVSNFDHASTVRRALERFQLRQFFERVFISEELGWRKPGKDFFTRVLEETGHTPAQCLYVGDDPEADVVGAGRRGFRVAWLRPDAAAAPKLKPE